jgi:3'-5' exonuclease
MPLVFDIETVGEDFDSLDKDTQENLTRWIRRESGDDEEKFSAKLLDLKEELGFSPLTGEIVAVGMYDTERGEGAVYYQSGDAEEEKKDGEFLYKTGSEAEIIKKFWDTARNYGEFASFNGRSFDVPFLAIRAAVHGIKVSVNLMGNRFLNENAYTKHIDLLDQLSFYGAVRRKGSLHMYCRAFGIASPKSEGVTGDDVAGLYKAEKYFDIARYNSRDLIATAELFRKWNGFLR